MEQSDWLENRHNSIGKSWEDTEDIKDKVIDEMANYIATSDSNLCEYLDMTTKCKYYAGENGKTCDECIKEYFYKKVRNNGIKIK